MTTVSDKVDGAAVAASFDALLANVRRNLELELRVASVARVITYVPTTQKADLRLELLPIKLTPGGNEIPGLPILLPQVPVRWLRSMAGAAYLSLPLLPGDTGHVLFADRALSVWLVSGNAAAPVDPISGRAHALGDAIFEPGVHSDAEPITPPTDLTGAVLEAPLVKLGAGATLGVALSALVHAYLLAMITAAPVAALDGGAAFKAGLLAYLGANPAATMGSATVLAKT